MKIPKYYDVLLKDAAHIVVQHQQGSASMLQRRLKLGYNHAGRIVDQLEVLCIVGPFEESRARQVLIGNIDDLEEFLASQEIVFYDEDEAIAKKEELIRKLSQKENALTQGFSISSFNQILSTNENRISGKDPKYILKFVRLGRYLRDNEKKIEELEYSLKDIPELNYISDQLEFLEVKNFILDRKHILNCLVINAIGMMTALMDDKMVPFFTIYEKYDELGVFNNAWQNEVRKTLDNIHSDVSESNNLLRSLVASVDNFEETMSMQLDGIATSIDISVSNLHESMEQRLAEIDDSVNVGNEIAKVIAYPDPWERFLHA